jgi:hypothetical protein
MSNDVVRAKTAEALASTGYNRLDAQKLLITWAMRDADFLAAITKPYLKAITAGLVDHALRQRSAGEAEAAGTAPEVIDIASPGGRTALDDAVASAVGRGGIPPKRKNPNIPPPKSTERQAWTMRKLVEAFSQKDKNK